ncbi:hypothetical protein [Halopseudomonas aestusnigri]|uniref:hypothetical protein n=1 Tax=Halopseudomonas aestusnigri TaxID=857252 RepID=UPI0030C76D31|tara:strand:+ start:23 stop:229 length:207 start_codon:yes stop_codon:yes gene_type:complete
MRKLFKPMRGCRIFASQKHMTEEPGTLLGWCEKVDGNICIYKMPASEETDRFIWRTSNGLNDWYEYAA